MRHTTNYHLVTTIYVKFSVAQYFLHHHYCHHDHTPCQNDECSGKSAKESHLKAIYAPTMAGKVVKIQQCRIIGGSQDWLSFCYNSRSYSWPQISLPILKLGTYQDYVANVRGISIAIIIITIMVTLS